MSRIWDSAFQHDPVLTYENLLAIGENIGPVKHPGFTPMEVDMIPFRRAKKENLQECPICLSDIELGTYLVCLEGCRHVFHAVCIKKWLEVKATCPICRLQVPHPVIVIND